MTESTAAATSGATTDGTQLRRVLKVPSLVLFGLAYMVPLTVFTTFGPVDQITDGHVPGAYVLTLAAMMFTAISYGRMSRRYPVAGSAYTYTQQSFGGSVGFLAGWALLLDYILLPMINYLVIGLYLNEAFPAVPQAAWIIAAIVLVTGLNVLGIKSVARMNFVLVAAQAVFIVVFIALAVRFLSGGALPSLSAPFTDADASFGSLATGASVLCLSFLGFDAVSTLSEEARNPRKDIPRAILATTIAGGVIFIVLSYVASLVIPDWHSFSDVDTASLDVMKAVGGAAFTSFFTAAYIGGASASALASQASVARILYTMGRDKVLPKPFFGRLNRRFGSPANAAVLVGVISLVALFISLDIAASIISFGALVAFSCVNLSVIKSHAIDRREWRGRAMLTHIVLPVIGFALTVWLWTSLPRDSLIVGLCWAFVGACYLLWLTRLFRRPTPTMDLAE